MAIEEYAGAIVLEVDGKEVECVDYGVTNKTGRKLVKTMNRTGRAKGYAKGVGEYELTITVVVPVSGDIDWGGIEGAKLTSYPNTEGGQRTSYLDCFTTEVGDKYSVDNEQRRDIKMNAIREVKE